MKKLVAALLTIFALSTYANEPWPGDRHGLKKPRYWDTYPAEFTQPMARACLQDKAQLPENARNALCVCIIWQIENYITFQRLAKKSDSERYSIIQAANSTCVDMLLN